MWKSVYTLAWHLYTAVLAPSVDNPCSPGRSIVCPVRLLTSARALDSLDLVSVVSFSRKISGRHDWS